MMKLLLGAAAFLGLGTMAQGDSSGPTGPAVLSGTVRVVDPPRRRKIRMDAEPAAAALHDGPVFRDDIVVDAESRVRWAFVSVKSGLEGKRVPAPQGAKLLVHEKCLVKPLVTPATVVTNASGTAVATWQLGAIPGPASVTATSGTFTARFEGGVNVTYASISAGGRSTCGITVDNVLVCWGYNGEGQLGIGQPPAGSGPVFAQPVPAAATGNLTFRQAVLNLYHGCAVTLASVGYCWGVNHDGRIGDRTAAAVRNAPTILGGSGTPSPFSFRMMAVSRNHTCGLALSDRIYCWGFAGEGQLGIGPPDSVGAVLAPVEPPGVGWVIASDSAHRFQAVVAGGQHTCAISTPMTASRIYCWGWNSLGQLGNGKAGGRDSVPQLVIASAEFSGRALDMPTPAAGNYAGATIAAGYDHTCALDTVGLVFCWGSNAKGQLGTAALGFGPGQVSVVPIDVAGGISFVAITAGEAHTCGLTFGGEVWCWGSNERGQIGNSGVGVGPFSVAATPVQVTAPGLVFMAVSAGDQHTCAITVNNRALCWGDNQYGQLGDNREHETPLTPSFLPRWQPRAVKFQTP